MVSSFPIPATHYKQIAHWNIRSIYFHNFCIVWLFAIVPLFSVLHFTPACLLKKCNILWGKGIFTNSSISIFEKNGKILQNLEHQYSIVKLHLVCLLYSVRIYLALIAYYHINGFQKQYLSIISSVLLLQKLYLDSDRFSLTLL